MRLDMERSRQDLFSKPTVFCLFVFACDAVLACNGDIRLSNPSQGHYYLLSFGCYTDSSDLHVVSARCTIWRSLSAS